MIEIISPKWIKNIVFLIVFLLTSCIGGGNYAPVIERKTHIGSLPKNHIVVSGETLFSIAWRYGIDYRRLVSANNISTPYTIYPGQKLRLGSAKVNPINAGRQSRAKVRAQRPAEKRQLPKSSSKTQSKQRKSGNYDKRPQRLRAWQWPVRGKVLKPFISASAVHKGIDIKGKLGEPVHAANSGEVVYAGSGLVGYGKLLIVKHDQQYLSAYGHNSKLLVKEGDFVKAGQRIASVGDTGTDKVMLHFEIRLNGKPVNPLKLLKK